MDDAGEKSVAKVAKLYPDIRVMEMSEKDPNAMLEAGKNDEIVDAFIKRQVWKPKSIVKPSQVSEEAIQKIEWGLSYPFPRLTEITYGARGGRSIGVGAGPGAGKTTFINQIASHLAFEHGQPIGYAGAEYQPSYSLRQLVATVMEKPIHLPDCNYDVAEAREVAKKLEDKFFFYDIGHYNGKWDCIEDFIRYLHVKCGVIYFFLDPMSGLTAGMDDSRINQWLHNTMFKLSLLVRELGVTVFHVSHLNNPKSGKDHDEGGKITGAQWSGSRAQWRYSTELWGLERNQQAETIAEKNTVNVRIIKDRLSGLTGSFKLKYDRDAGILVPLGQSAGSFSNLNQP